VGGPGRCGLFDPCTPSSKSRRASGSVPGPSAPHTSSRNRCNPVSLRTLCPESFAGPPGPSQAKQILAHHPLPHIHRRRSGLYQGTGLAPTGVPNLTVLNDWAQPWMMPLPFQQLLLLYLQGPVRHRPSSCPSFAPPFASFHQDSCHTNFFFTTARHSFLPPSYHIIFLLSISAL